MIVLPAKLVRTVLQSGDSKVVALPPAWARIFKIDLGNKLDVFYNSLIIIKPHGMKFDPAFLRKEFDLILKLESEAQ